MTGLKNYSVLMPLWYKENLLNLEQSIQSMLGQTIPPSEIVLIADHELPEKMINLISDLGKKCSKTEINIYHNHSLFGKGLGAVLAYGVTKCRYNYIARMDTDDISLPERCEKELKLLSRGTYQIVGGGLAKFSVDPNTIDGYRIPPTEEQKLRKYSKLRSPFNHPTVMFEKSAVLAVGNYKELKQCEDFDLWYRLFQAGYRGINLPDIVLKYRSGKDMLARRKNKAFYEQSLRLIDEMKETHYINSLEQFLAKGMHFIRYHCPLILNKIVYKYVKG